MSNWWHSTTSAFSSFDYHILWQPKELLLVQPSPTWELRWGYVAFIALFWVVGLTLSLLKIHHRWKERLFPVIWTNAVLGIILYFFRDQRIPYLGMDLFRTIQEVTALLWLAYALFLTQNHVKEIKLNEAVAARRAKYLPKNHSY